MGPMEGITWKACMGLKLTPVVVKALGPSRHAGPMAGTSWTHSYSK